MGQDRPGGGIGLLISPTGSSLPDPLQAATKQFTAKTPEPCWLTGTKAPNKRRSWLAAPAPLQYARPDNNSQFLAQVTNPQAFVIASYFPNLPELLMTVGYIALGIVAFDLAVKYFAVLPGEIEEWNHMFRLVRPLRLRAWRGASARRAAPRAVAGSQGEKPWPASL